MLNINRRRVSVRHKQDSLVIKIERHGGFVFYIIMLVVITAVFGFFWTIFIPAFLKITSAIEFVILLLPCGFVSVWFFLGCRIAMWRAFGVEHIAVEGGAMTWLRKALCWTRTIQVATSDIGNITAKTPWHGLDNRVELVIDGRKHRMGDMILQDEALNVARELKRAIPHL